MIMTRRRALIPLPTHGFDPTKAPVSWKVVWDAGHEVVFVTGDGDGFVDFRCGNG